MKRLWVSKAVDGKVLRVIITNTSLKSDSCHATPRFKAMIPILPLIVMGACLVAAFGRDADGSQNHGVADKSATDKPATSKTLVATEGMERLERLAVETMVVELSDGTLFVSGYDNDSEKALGCGGAATTAPRG